MVSLTSIYFGGVLTLLMAVFHTRFYKLFKWKPEFRNVTQLNRKVFYTIHLALTLLFFGFGFLTLIYAQELSKCVGISLGINLLISILWIWRTIWQVIYFKGKTMHYVLIACFFLLFVSYLIPVMVKLLWKFKVFNMHAVIPVCNWSSVLLIRRQVMPALSKKN